MPSSIASLRRKRQTLIQRLPPLARRVVRGSLIERYLPCGKPGCHCASGRGHGPKYYLSVSYPNGRPQLQYLTQKQHTQVQALLKNFQHVRDLLEQICDNQSPTLTPPGESLSDAAGGLADRSSTGGASGCHHAPGLPSGRRGLAFASFGDQRCL